MFHIWLLNQVIISRSIIIYSVWVDEERQNDDNKARWWGWDCASIQFEVGSQPTKVEIYVYYHDLCVERWSMGGGWCRHRGSEAARALSVASRSCRPPWSRSPTAVASPGAASLLLPRESHVCLIKVCSSCRRSRHCPAAQYAHSPLVWSQDSPWPMLRESFPSCVLRPRNTSRRACLRDTRNHEGSSNNVINDRTRWIYIYNGLLQSQ